VRRILSIAAAALLLVALSACGDDEQPVVSPGADGDDSVSTTVDPGLDPGLDDGTGDEFPTESARETARGYLGMYEDDLPPDVRVARRGDEEFALTEDYRLGRVTVELDDTDGDGFRVTSLVVELPDGPETFELEPG
jgi:hypothetical protein